MKLLHVITSIGHGGAQRQMMQMTGALGAMGYQQRVATLFDRGEFSVRHATAPVPVHPLGADRSLWFAWRRLRSLMREMQPDLVQAWLYHANVAVALTGTPIPVLWNIRHSLHQLEREKRTTRFVIRAGALLSRRPAVIVYNSERCAVQHRAAGYDCDRQVVIDNGVDCRMFGRDPGLRARQRAAWGMSDDDWVVAIAGRHHPGKGVDMFLRATATAGRTRKDIHAVLVGEGMDAANPAITEALASMAGPLSVRLLGPQADMPAILNGIDVLVSASSGEASSNVVAEAAATGATCIVTDVGESRRLVGDAGIVLAEPSETCLVSALTKVFNEGRQCWSDRGDRAAQHIRNHYSLERCVDAYDRLYRSVCSPEARTVLRA